MTYNEAIQILREAMRDRFVPDGWGHYEKDNKLSLTEQEAVTFAIQALEGVKEVHDKSDTFNKLGNEYETAWCDGFDACLTTIEEKIELLSE